MVTFGESYEVLQIDLYTLQRSEGEAILSGGPRAHLPAVLR